MESEDGIVYLVGAGPGDPDLITVKGRELLSIADVVVHDRLIGQQLLQHARSGAEIIDVGKVPGKHAYRQEEINDLLVDRARRGCMVVRLKGGDAYVFGRGWEELRACRRAGLACSVVPGISSALAVPAAAGIPLTLRGVSRSFAVVTGHLEAGEHTRVHDFRALSRIDTLVVLMGQSNLREFTDALITAGKDGSTPAACIERGTTPRQRVATATLSEIADRAESKALKAPLITVIGPVTANAQSPQEGATQPFESKRIILTRPPDASEALKEALSALGAVVLNCPLIKTVFPETAPELDRWVSRLSGFDWIIFTSRNGVIGFWKRLEHLGLDSRALAGCKIACVGPRSREALCRRGVTPDLVPDSYRAAGLLDALVPLLEGNNQRVLLPRSDIALTELPDTLKGCGVEVVEAVAYRTVAIVPDDDLLEEVRQPADAILFYSPSAVHSHAALEVPCGPAITACIGPSTAQAALQAGLNVDVIAEEHNDAGMLRALRSYFGAIPCET